jgi:hypothetical protein
MVLITKEEKEAIVQRFPDTYIVRTMKQKSKRHRYYCVESRPVMRYLKELRGEYVPNKRKRGDRYTGRKTRW